MAKEELKSCLVISPIGEEGSETRKRSDQVLQHIIKPAAIECGYDAIRADEIAEPGMITSKVIQRLLDDPLVIADLTDQNPNVYYELAVRHAVRKPVVQIIESGHTIPFDISQSRTIPLDHHDLDSVAKCKDLLVKQIKSAKANPMDVDTPISQAVDLQVLRQSENPLEKSNAEILARLELTNSEIRELSNRLYNKLDIVHKNINNEIAEQSPLEEFLNGLSQKSRENIESAFVRMLMTIPEFKTKNQEQSDIE